jgi:uncharacterized membrane protein
VLIVASVFTKVFFVQLAKKDPVFQELGGYIVIVFWTLMGLAIACSILGRMILRSRAKKTYAEKKRNFELMHATVA